MKLTSIFRPKIIGTVIEIKIISKLSLNNKKMIFTSL